ncbi:PfkB family carbohydrate kinase [Cellulomonas sp. URHD0024]|uniref:PfkB family carbohydrate kinase n=1 Tax=Cellulomonas sp. URHD0024 TaxID=1302620 RepID=UPI0004886F4E|nr:PfkB family carbohydrate kinase [Cellulomonas sp. URHD0024]
MHDPTYLVVGESVADLVRAADGRSTIHPGGSPMNVAFGLGRLGRATTLVTQLGDDDNGRTIRSHLLRAGVSVIDTGPRNQATPTATAFLDAYGAARYSFDITWNLTGPASPPTATHVHTGSIAAYLSPGSDVVEAMVAQLVGTATVSFDPNIRPALITDRDDAVRRTARLLALTDVVKASDDDLTWLYPGEAPASVARRWVEAGPTLVVVTRGAAGAIAATADGVFHIPPVRADVVDTVGAGDSFMAAVLDGLGGEGLLGAGARSRLRNSRVDQLRPILERAAAAAAITVSRAGAEPPTVAELAAV